MAIRPVYRDLGHFHMDPVLEFGRANHKCHQKGVGGGTRTACAAAAGSAGATGVCALTPSVVSVDSIKAQVAEIFIRRSSSCLVIFSQAGVKNRSRISPSPRVSNTSCKRSVGRLRGRSL